MEKVIFRIDNLGVFAIFPELPGSKPSNCLFYTHVGQHGEMIAEIPSDSRAATPEEYADLKAELDGIYGGVTLRRNITPTHNGRRRDRFLLDYLFAKV